MLTVAQILIFLIKSAVRASQHLAITSLELTTLAFIFAMVLASWFWKNKPQDINKPIIVKSRTAIPEILSNVRPVIIALNAVTNAAQAGAVFNENYVYTPLDFLNNEEWFINMAWTRGRKFLRKATLGLFWNEDQVRPVKRLRSDILPSLSLPLMIICEHIVIATAPYSSLAGTSSFPLRRNVSFGGSRLLLCWALVYLEGGSFFSWTCSL